MMTKEIWYNNQFVLLQQNLNYETDALCGEIL